MTRLGSIVGFALGVLILVAAFVGTQLPSSAETQTAALDAGCVAEKVALDEGYGVTRTETRIVCREGARAQDKAEEKKD